MTLEVGQTALQLDELRLAKGSPTGAAMEDYQSLPATSGLVKMHKIAVLVWQHHIREALANSRANVAEVDTEIRNCSHRLASECRLNRVPYAWHINALRSRSSQVVHFLDGIAEQKMQRHFDHGLRSLSISTLERHPPGIRARLGILQLSLCQNGVLDRFGNDQGPCPRQHVSPGNSAYPLLQGPPTGCWKGQGHDERGEAERQSEQGKDLDRP